MLSPKPFQKFSFDHPMFSDRSPQVQLFMRRAYKSGMRRGEYVETMLRIHEEMGKGFGKYANPKFFLAEYERLNEKFDYFHSEEMEPRRRMLDKKVDAML